MDDSFIIRDFDREIIEGLFFSDVVDLLRYNFYVDFSFFLFEGFCIYCVESCDVFVDDIFSNGEGKMLRYLDVINLSRCGLELIVVF